MDNVTILQLIQQILRPSPRFSCSLSGIQKERILELYALGIDDQITLDTLKKQFLLAERKTSSPFFPATAFSLLKIFDALNDGVLLLDHQGFVRYINASFERIAQTDRHLLIGRPLLESRPGARLMDVVKRQKAALGIKRVFNENQYITDMYPIIVKGKTIGGVTIARDITELRNLQFKLHDYHVKYTDLLDKERPRHQSIYQFSDIIGSSPKMHRAKALALKLAASSLDILIRGASGTGKELFAHSIHAASDRACKPFVTINCPAIPDSLLESELFGYVKGAFTGAHPKGKGGLIALADGGTLFLDEIGDLDIQLQAKLLRVLQTGEYQPVGSTKYLKANFRLISATNRPIEELINKKLFREDLFYRINVSTIELPSLTGAAQDILTLADFFLRRYSGTSAPFRLSREVEKIFMNYSWPGNIRELENTIRFITAISDSPVIEPDLLPNIFFQEPHYLHGCHDLKSPRLLQDYCQATERQGIIQALQRFGTTVKGKKEAAASLGISLSTLYEKIKKYDLRCSKYCE